MTSHRPLTRMEAAARAAQLVIHEVHVELDLTDQTSPTFTSRSTCWFDCVGADTFVDFQGRELVSASLNGQPVHVGTWAEGRLPLAVPAGPCVLVVEGVMAYSSDGEGLHRHVDPEDGETYLYAMSFLDAGPRWFASFDQPDLKARYVFDVAAPQGWTVVGNGPSEPTAPGRWRITPLAPLSTYVLTLVAGPYASVRAEHRIPGVDGSSDRVIPLGLHARASLRSQLEAEADDLLEVTRAGLDYFENVFGSAYPFGEYHQAFVPDFNAGAMENPGCVTFRDQMIFRGRATEAERARRAGVVTHEMAHMWFGDLVTMRWWDDLWLNESFAEYMGHRACTDATRYALWTEFGVVRKDWGSVADQAPSTHPVAGNGSPDSAAALADFDGISYAKGAAVLRQLAARLGEDVFFGGLRIYFDRHGYGNATFADLVACWTEAGAVDLDRWAAAWLRTSGMDTLDVEGGPPAVRVLSRPAGGDSPNPAGGPRRPHAISVAAVSPAGEVSVVASVVLDADPVDVVVPADAALVVPDRYDTAWAKIRFGPNGWRDVAAALPALADEPVLVVVYNALRDAVRDQTLSPLVALRLIVAHVAHQPSLVLAGGLLGFALDQLCGPYAAVGERALRREMTHQAVAAWLAAGEPGADAQLVAFRLAVRSSADRARLAAWLVGDEVPEGIAIDPELRWALITRLVALGADPAMVAEELGRDRSAAAHQHAARARAGQPDAAAKEQAWGLLMEPSAAGAYELYATAEGFFGAEQTDLTAPYAVRYFDQIGPTATFRTGWALGEVAARAFPATVVTPDVLARAEALLGDEQLAAPIRRAVVDGTDRLRRALASVTHFGESQPPSPT